MTQLAGATPENKLVYSDIGAISPNCDHIFTHKDNANGCPTYYHAKQGKTTVTHVTLPQASLELVTL